MNRVLIYCTKLWVNGGIESHILQFCEQMHKEGVQVDILVPEFSFKKRETEIIKSYCRRLYYCRSKNPFIKKLWLAGIVLWLRKTKYKALYTNGQGESVLLVSKLTNHTKWVHHHHHSGDAEDQATWGNAYKKALLASNSVIACSYRNAGMMEKALGRKIDVVTCFSRSVVVKETDRSPGSSIRFGYFGRLIPEKGIDYICRLSEDSEIKNAEFHIWGEGEAYSQDHFTRFPNIVYHGPFSGREGLVKAISSIDAFLLLSHHPEGLPISLLEVMSAGIPWLASDRGGIRDIACDSMSTRIIEGPLDYDKVKASVLSLIDDLQEGKISKKAQIQHYNSRFSSDALALEWKKMLFVK